MNSSGYIRGYMAKNMDTKDFIKVVVNALEKEFKSEIKLIKSDRDFKITLDNYCVSLDKELAQKIKSPYGIDRYILEQLESQGFSFDRNRSQYIMNIFGTFGTVNE